MPGSSLQSCDAVRHLAPGLAVPLAVLSSASGVGFRLSLRSALVGQVTRLATVVALARVSSSLARALARTVPSGSDTVQLAAFAGAVGLVVVLAMTARLLLFATAQCRES